MTEKTNQPYSSHLRLSTPKNVLYALCVFYFSLSAQKSLAENTQQNVAGNEIVVAMEIDTNLTSDPLELFIADAEDNDSEYSQEDIWVRIRDGFQMPDVESEYTAKHENWYASRPDYMKRMLERSQKYLFHIVEEVQKRDMPTEIALLPMIESAYNPQAYSKSHASGIWQFVPATGKDFGLKQNWWSDNRRDVMAATKAALTYLQRLHGMFGSWDLALAAYNAGEGTVSRAIERNRRLGLPTDYKNLDLSAETKNYVPKLQAIKNIIFNPDQYGLTIQSIPNRPYFTQVIAPKQIDAQLAAKLAEVSYDEFSALNPSYNRPVIISNNNEVHKILLPTWAADKFKENLANYDKPLTNWKTYSAKRGERIDYIAKKFNIQVSELKQINNLKSSNKVSANRPILVPSNGDDEETITQTDLNFEESKAIRSSRSNDDELTSIKTITYKVKRGDTLSGLAKKFKVDSKSLLRTNQLRSAKHIKPGQLIKIVGNRVSKSKSSRLSSSKHKKYEAKTKSRSHFTKHAKSKRVVHAKSGHRAKFKSAKKAKKPFRISSRKR